MKELIGHRLQVFHLPESMGVVRDTRYRHCYWPTPDHPVAIFADGSTGIEVEGGSLHNIIFPEGTVFRDYWPDALYPAELAFRRASPRKAGLINLTEEEAAIWVAAYDAAVAEFPPTHTVFSTNPHSYFLKHREIVRERRSPALINGVLVEVTKRDYEPYIAEITKEQALDIVAGRADPETLKAAVEFVHFNSQSKRDNPEAKTFTLAKVEGVDKVQPVEAEAP